MSKPERLTAAVRVVLDLLAAPRPPVDLWTPVGVRRFLQTWQSAPTGSPDELRNLIALADPDARVTVTDLSGRVAVAVAFRRWESLRAIAEAGVAPARLAEATRRIVAWWAPFGVEPELAMSWPGAPLLAVPSLPVEPIVEPDRTLLLQVAGDLLGVQRRPGTPARTWVALHTEAPAARGRHELVLSNPHLDQFLWNVGPWHATWRIDRIAAETGRTDLRLTALRAAPEFAVLTSPALAGPEFRLDGEPLAAAPLARWPEYHRFRLAVPLVAGKRYRLICTHGDGEEAPVWVNPALFEACRYDRRRRKYVTDGRPDGDPAGSYPDLIVGQGKGAAALVHHQPFPVAPPAPPESDASVLARAARMMIGGKAARRADLDRLVAAALPGVVSVRSREGEWTETVEGWLRTRHGLRVVIELESTATSHEAARNSLARVVRRLVPLRLPIRIDLTRSSSS